MELDGIHPRVLRKLAEELAKPLSIIYQQSWLTGEIPGGWSQCDTHLQEGPEGGSREVHLECAHQACEGQPGRQAHPAWAHERQVLLDQPESPSMTR